MQHVIRALCERMREEQDFSAFPILADAVEESGDAALASVYRSDLHFGERAFIVDSILGLDEPWRQLSDWIRDDYYEGRDPSTHCYRDYLHAWENGPLTPEKLVTILHNRIHCLSGDIYVAFGFDERPGHYELAEMWRLLAAHYRHRPRRRGR